MHTIRRVASHPGRLLLGACLTLLTTGRAGATITFTPGANTVSTSRLELDFGGPNVERVDSVRWRNSDGLLGPNLVAAGGAAPACTAGEPLEAWGQAYGSTPPYLPVPVAAGASGTWQVKGTRTIEIASTVPAACFNDDPTPVRTRYSFFDTGPAANTVRIERRFDFDTGSPDYTTEGLRPYVMRLSSTPQMLFPNATGTALVVTGTSDGGIITDDWDGTWLALNDPNQAGVVLLRDPGNPSPAKLILDYDAASGSYLSSVDLTRPATGWKAPLTEIEYLCFYDAISWPVAARAPGAPPPGCRAMAVPINTGAPQVAGAPQVDGELTASPGTWDDATDAFGYQWLRCDGDACVPIPGATAPSYTPGAADAGHTLRVDVTAVSADGEAELASATSDVVTAEPCAGDALCQVDDGPAFRAATTAMPATGNDADGAPLPLPDLGAVKKTVTLGAVTLQGKNFFVGAAGDPTVEGGDWSPLLPGPDIALAGSGRKKKLALQFAAPVFAAGFEVVEPETGPNVGPVFSDATFTLKLKRGRTTVAETLFNAPNDVAAYVGLWSDQPFDRMEIRSKDAAGAKIFGKIDVGYLPGFGRRRDILVVAGGGTGSRGTLHEVNSRDGTRPVVQDFGIRDQGPLGNRPVAVAVASPDVAMVLDDRAGTNDQPALFRVDLRSGIRTVLSDFGNPGQGPAGNESAHVAVEASGTLLVVDRDAGTNLKGALFRVDPISGNRSVVSDFGQGQRRGEEPYQVSVETSGSILVLDYLVDSDPASAGQGALFRVHPKNGSRAVLSDFSNPAQGPVATDPRWVAVEASGQILVVDRGDSKLLRVHPTTGTRAQLSDFRTGLQGFAAGPGYVAVDASGQILVLVSSQPFSSKSLVRVHPLTGYRTFLTDLFSGSEPEIRTPQNMAIRR